jgi:uncharacterized protein with NRDE domain
MCLILFSFKNHPEYPLILAGNRDEFYGREAQQAHFWNSIPSMLAGKDLRAGGTWLGVSGKGEFGAVTNYRDLRNPINGDRSRGEIIPGFLAQNGSIEKKLHQVKKNYPKYSGFNLLAGNADQLYYLNNINRQFRKVNPGINGVSNAFLDTSWPKVEKAKVAFRQATKPTSIDRGKILQLLQDSESFPQEILPDTGLDPEMEKAVSPIFIKTENYGTRCSTLLTIDNEGQVHFTEKTYHINGEETEVITEYNFGTAI